MGATIPVRAALGLCLLASACGDDAPPAGRPPNVVVYVIDTLRADHLSCYGYERTTSPRLDELSEQCVVQFERAVAQAPWTLPSVASLLTSSYAVRHRVVAGGRRIAEQVEILPEYLRRHGYRTAGFVGNPVAGRVIGADVGYDEYWGPEYAPSTSASEWIRDWHRDRPFFAYVHTTEPHIPYRPGRANLREPLPDPERVERLNAMLLRFAELTHADFAADGEAGRRMESLRAGLAAEIDLITALYDAEIRRADANLAVVVESLREAGHWPNTVLLVTSDHGEEILDHGYLLHDQSLHAELLHVPLLIRVPGVPGRRVGGTAQLIDLMPTLAELIGGEADPAWQGRSLVSALHGEAPPRTAKASRMNTKTRDPYILSKRGSREFALLRGHFKAIYHADLDDVSLYDIAADPAETQDIARERPGLAAELREELEHWATSQREAPGLFTREALTAPEVRAMGALGYTLGEEAGD